MEGGGFVFVQSQVSCFLIPIFILDYAIQLLGVAWSSSYIDENGADLLF